LASVLLAEPVVGLGDEFTARRVGLQQERYSPVDDVLVEGECNGRVRRLRVACRRRPTIGRSDESTVKLFADYVATLLATRADLERGSLRLGLAVAGPFGPASDLETLADVARRQPDRVTFAEAIRAPDAYSEKVRRRLEHVDGLVTEALAIVDGGADEDPEIVTWELLRSLYVIQIQLEGDAAPGRTDLVARLQTLTGTPDAADKLRRRLVEIASQGAIRAGLLDRAMLRRELVGFGHLGASQDFVAARKQVDTLEAELRRRTQRSLPVPGSDSAFVLERRELRSELTTAISTLPPGGVLIVHGEPGAGKSALVLSVADAIRESGGAVLAMSLRDLPSKAVEFRPTVGLAPDDLIAAAPSSELSVLLLDGAEALQEGEAQAAAPLIEVCRTTGRRTVLVARDDARGVVHELARTAGGDEPREFTVPPLSDGEVAEVIRAVPALNRLASDDRSKWLLRRLGLIELLLQSAEKGAELPRSLASEADVFRVVWRNLVRQSERQTASVSSDDREAAAVSVAEDLLKGSPRISTGAAYATLRSDGILLPRGETSPWQRGDEFASDVIRDFAVARLLIIGGLDVLAKSAAPRWAVRAARIYAQAKIAEALGRGGNALAGRWDEVRREFGQLASDHGARWRDIPWEAVLTAGWVNDVLDGLKLDLLGNREVLDEALRCVDLRFSEADACDPFIAAPLARYVVQSGGIEGTRVYGDDPLIDFVASWLRGVARREAAGDDVSALRPLRGRVRDALLRRPPDRGERTRLECLGLLGGDATPESRKLLRHMASAAPAFLAPVVESFDVANSLAKHDVELLAELTEAYYIKQPTDRYLGSHLMDDGIRSHEGGGLTTPLAAWYRGPFLFLLRANWQLGLGVIDRMLDRGARNRIEVLNALERRRGERAFSNQQEMGISMDLFGYGPRMYLGDAHVWSWYRGSSVGPYPCMSALFALEMVLDELVQAGFALRSIVKALLRNAATLATPGLAYGFLVRHIDRVTDELDDFLAVPEVWQLEFGRTISEGRLHVQGPDPANRIGKERRRWTPRDVASQLVLDAARRGDDETIDRLRGVGRTLIKRAGGDDAPPEVVQWAAHLDWDSYEMETEGNRLIVQVRPPQEGSVPSSV
jgi:energy-coupling factor transporter ATP-binding protein EcfA2